MSLDEKERPETQADRQTSDTQSTRSGTAKAGGNRTRSLARYGIRSAAQSTGDASLVQRKALDHDITAGSAGDELTSVGGELDPFALHLQDESAPAATSVQRKRAVQATANDALATDPDQTQQLAAAGVEGAGGPVPHAEQIKRSFGKFAPHVNDVHAHVGGPAAAAAVSIGAEAFATGQHVAFKSSAPDLHTTAHEVAHTVQQRQGVSLLGGVGQAGDRYEQHADAVAGAVVAGESAEALLEQVPDARHDQVSSGAGDNKDQPHAGHPPAAPNIVQRKTDDTRSTGVPNDDYIRQHAVTIMFAVTDRITAAPLTQPHPRLRWKSESIGKAAIGRAITQHVYAGPDDLTLKRMELLTAPADLVAIVDAARRGPEGSRGDAVKIVVAAAFDEPIVASILRMGARACVQYDANHGKPVPASSLTASSPLDRVIGELLVDPEVVDHTAAKHGGADDTSGRPFLHGTRPIKFDWLGARDPQLWNWIKVTSPANATVEDVAQHPFWGDEVPNTAEQAYRIAANPPYFGIPFETARLVPQMVVHAPEHLRAKLQHDVGPRDADATKLATSAVSDDAAREQAPPLAKDAPPAAQLADRCLLQLGFMNQELAPWHANEPLAGAIMFIDRRKLELAGDSKKAQGWAAALAAQERVLFAASSELTAVMADVTASGAKPSDAAALGPVLAVMTAYARAAGESHLHAQAPAALAEARRLKTLLPLALAEDRIRGARGEVAHQRETEAGAESREPHSAETPQDVTDQLQRAADLRMRAVHGQPLDPDAVEQLTVDASETELRARLVTLATEAQTLRRRADEVGVPDSRGPNGEWSVQQVAALILQKINGPAGGAAADKNDHSGGGWHEQLDSAAKYSSPRKGMTGDQTVVAQRRAAIKHVSDQLSTFGKELDLGEYLTWSLEQIHDQELANLIKKIAIQIGVAVVTGQAIGAAGAAIRGVALAGEIGAELREASLLYKAGTMLAEAAANTATQGAMGGPMGVRDFAENTLAIVLTSAALKPFQSLLHDSAAVENEIRTLRQLARRGGKLAVEVTVDAGGSIAASGLAHALVHGGDMSMTGAEDWITTSLMIAASKFVHERTTGMQHRIMEAAQRYKLASADALLARVTALNERSANPARTAEEGIAQLSERHALLIEERRLYQEANATRELGETSSDLAATGADFADVPLQLAQLSPIVQGHIYEGTQAAIEHAFRAADAAGVPLTHEWIPEQQKYRVTSGKRVIEIHELGKHGGATDRVPDRTPGVYDETGDASTRKPFSPEGVAENHKIVHGGDPGLNAIVGYVGNEQTGREILQRLSHGDRTALTELGVPHSEGFNPSSREWGIGRQWDGKLVVIAGEPGAVDWSVVHGVTPLGHSHPRDVGRRVYQGGRKLDVKSLVSSGADGQPGTDTALVFPSPPDIEFMVLRGLHDHFVAVPYEQVGAGEIALAKAGGATSKRVSFELSGGERTIGDGSPPAIAYTVKARMVADGTSLWSGELTAIYEPNAKPRLAFERMPKGSGAAGASTGSTPHRVSSGGAYDPTGRTLKELQADRLPQPQPGESPADAATRVRSAESELIGRAPTVMEALGDAPRRIDLRSEDPTFDPEGAHTIENHGADIPLRVADNPGGKSIEGRIDGLPPWPSKVNSSYKWISDQVMNKVINDYLHANWEAIRIDLALNGRHAKAFDAQRKIGEGFFNEGMYGKGPRHAKYSTTSLVRIAVVLDGGSPPRYFVYTTFPNALGGDAY